MRHAAKNPVGRPREFDEDEVLAAAMDVFWLQGYESTSMADLLGATGLHKGSLYQAFGDKHSLFIQALQRYIDEFRKEMSVVVNESETGLAAVRALMLKSIEKGCHGTNGNAGCLALNTLIEKGTADADVMGVLTQAYGKRLELFIQAVVRAQEEGSLRNDIAPKQMALMINVMALGLVATLRGPLNEEQSVVLIEDYLSTLKPM